jgi:hypothetical protein
MSRLQIGNLWCDLQLASYSNHSQTSISFFYNNVGLRTRAYLKFMTKFNSVTNASNVPQHTKVSHRLKSQNSSRSHHRVTWFQLIRTPPSHIACLHNAETPRCALAAERRPQSGDGGGKPIALTAALSRGQDGMTDQESAAIWPSSLSEPWLWWNSPCLRHCTCIIRRPTARGFITTAIFPFDIRYIIWRA